MHGPHLIDMDHLAALSMPTHLEDGSVDGFIIKERVFDLPHDEPEQVADELLLFEFETRCVETPQGFGLGEDLVPVTGQETIQVAGQGKFRENALVDEVDQDHEVIDPERILMQHALAAEVLGLHTTDVGSAER